MPTTMLRLSAQISAPAERIYEAWLSAREHSAFTCSKATISPKKGGKFNVCDGYITGVTLELEEGRRIVQTWRTTEFPKDAPDSTLEILLEPLSADKTRLTLVHKGLPPGDGPKYKDGWIAFYIDPLKEYFKSQSGQSPKPRAQRTASKVPAKKRPAKPIARQTGTPRKAPAKTTGRTPSVQSTRAKKASAGPARKRTARRPSSK